jgi:hypothetical protein
LPVSFVFAQILFIIKFPQKILIYLVEGNVLFWPMALFRNNLVWNQVLHLLKNGEGFFFFFFNLVAWGLGA